MDKKMTNKQKILTLLATATAQTPRHTTDIRADMKDTSKGEVLTALEELLAAGKVGHCKITKNEVAIDWWWLAGNFESTLLPQTAAANRKTKATARKENAKRIAGMAWWNK